MDCARGGGGGGRSAQGGVQLAGALTALTRLADLDVSHNALGPEGVAAITHALPGSPPPTPFRAHNFGDAFRHLVYLSLV